MPRTPIPAEYTLRGRQLGIINRRRNALITKRNREESEAAERQARIDLAAEVAAALPELTAEQREQLRPILSGSLDQAGADTTAA